MSMNQPFTWPFTQASTALAGAAQTIMKGDPPKWFGPVLTIASLGALALDYATMYNLGRVKKDVDVEERLIQNLDAKITQMQSPAASAPVNVTVNVGAPAPDVQTSRYLIEEGSTDTATDCFACASSHLAGIKGSLNRARAAGTQDGKCGDECQGWMNTVVQEGTALLAKDWTEEKINAQPEHKRRVLEKYRSEVEGIVTDALGGNEQVMLVNQGASSLDESLRFTNAGDPLDHPEVDDRLKDAEVALATAERADVTAWDTDTANELRSVRQAVGNKINTPEDLKQVRTQARELAGRVNRRAFEELDNRKIAELDKRGAKVFDGFKRDRRRVG